jgi:hypothetical protein
MFRTNHAIALQDFREKFRRNPAIIIRDARFSTYILWALKLTGKEQRSLTEDEVTQLLARYSFFRTFFTRSGLWIEERNVKKFFRT